jgi:hypothetical protein
MKPKAIHFPNEPNLKRDIKSEHVSALISRPTQEYLAGDTVILIPKNTDPWEEKAFLVQVNVTRTIQVAQLTDEEIKQCGCNTIQGLLPYYRRFFDDDLNLESEITFISWHRTREVDPGDYGYRAPNFNNQQSSAP